MPECLVRGTSGRFGDHHQNVVGSAPARHNYYFRCDDSTLHIDRPHSTGRVIALHLWERFLSAALETLNVTVTRNQGIRKNPKWPQRARGRPPPCWCAHTTRTSKSQRGSLCFQYTEKKTGRTGVGASALQQLKTNKNKTKQNKTNTPQVALALANGWTECYVQTDKTDSWTVLKRTCQTRNPENKTKQNKKGTTKKRREVDNADLWVAAVCCQPYSQCSLAPPSFALTVSWFPVKSISNKRPKNKLCGPLHKRWCG